MSITGKIVIGCPSIFKGFQTKKEAKRYLESISDEEVNEKIICGKIYRFNRLKYKLQEEYGFKISNYIVDEIINNDDYDNLCLLVNLAVSNKKISKEEGQIIKK